MRRALFVTVVVAALLVLGANAWACPVCGGTMPRRTLNAYFKATVLLSLLPLTLGGGFLLLARNREDDEQG